MYHYHGLEDELVPLNQDVNLHYDWCKLGATDDFQLYTPSTCSPMASAAPTALKWIEERVAGKTAPSTCGQHSPGATLPANARLTPEIGDLIVKLNEWSLKGKVTEKKSGISEEVPAGATISSTADATTGTLTATLNIPPINQTFWIGLIPVTVSGGLTPTGPADGHVRLQHRRQRSVRERGRQGQRGSEGRAESGSSPLPIGCKTVEPIDLPLSISEPTNALATGSFAFKAEVTVPEFGGCGLLGPLISSTTSGPGNTVEMTAAPPPPINW